MIKRASPPDSNSPADRRNDPPETVTRHFRRRERVVPDSMFPVCFVATSQGFLGRLAGEPTADGRRLGVAPGDF